MSDYIEKYTAPLAMAGLTLLALLIVTPIWNFLAYVDAGLALILAIPLFLWYKHLIFDY